MTRCCDRDAPWCKAYTAGDFTRETLKPKSPTPRKRIMGNSSPDEAYLVRHPYLIPIHLFSPAPRVNISNCVAIYRVRSTYRICFVHKANISTQCLHRLPRPTVQMRTVCFAYTAGEIPTLCVALRVRLRALPSAQDDIPPPYGAKPPTPAGISRAKRISLLLESKNITFVLQITFAKQIYHALLARHININNSGYFYSKTFL